MPEYKLTVDNPRRPKGDEIDVPPFGRVENGKSITVEMTAEEAQKYRESPIMSVKQTSGRKTDADREAEAEVSTIEDAHEGGES